MAKRKGISAKLRFEIFKRDSFTCQYCGRMAPDVLLEVDHIQPVSKGGTNDIVNLVTACRECNRGKFDKELSDNTTLRKQQETMRELAEKREQLDLLITWRQELLDIDSGVANRLAASIEERYRIHYSTLELTEFLRRCIKKYTARAAIDACYAYQHPRFDRADFEQYCKYAQRDIRNPWAKDLNYIVKILHNRRIIESSEKPKLFQMFKPLLSELYGTPEYTQRVQELKTIAATCESYSELMHCYIQLRKIVKE